MTTSIIPTPDHPIPGRPIPGCPIAGHPIAGRGKDAIRRSSRTIGRTIRAARVLALVLALAAAVGLIPPATARADSYTLQRGDTVALSVVGASELQQSMTVNIDGDIMVPLVGPVAAAGRSLDSVTDDVRNALSQASYTVVSGSGALLTLQILPAAVMLSMADYRPVYVDGDVQSPGAFPYAPGLTARRAIALAGGYGLARLLGSDPMPQLLGLQADQRRLIAERAATEAEIERVKTLLAGDAAADTAGDTAGDTAEKAPAVTAAATADAPAGSLAAAFAAIEQQRLDTDSRLSQELAAHYDAALAKTTAQIATLEERLNNETEGVAADAEDFQRLRDAQTKGTVSLARLSDGRRTLLLSTTGELQTRSELDRAKMELEGLRHERDRGRIDEHAARLAALRDAQLSLEATNASLAAAERQFTYFRGVISDPESGSDTAIRITHPDGTRQDLGQGEDPVLGPGDLVSVRLSRSAVTD